MKKTFIFILTILFFSFSFSYAYTIKRDNSVANYISEVKSHYNKYVKTTDDTPIYKIVNGEYTLFGTIGKNNELELSDIIIDQNTELFNILNTDYYIIYRALEPIESLTKASDRYKRYIPFNENIITNEQTTFIDEDGNFITYNQSYDLPIIIKDIERYGVEFNNKLYYIKSSDVAKNYEHENSKEAKRTKIRTLTYHFLYDKSVTKCNEEICLEADQLEEQLKYLHDNNFLTLRLPELEMFLDGKINIPMNSVVLTIDDGTVVSKKAISLFEKYQEYATIFVVTGFVKDLSTLKSDYLDLESHSDNMHNQYECVGKGLQGGAILCKSEEYILNDLKTCQEKLGGSVYFAYPFFDFDNRAISILKKAGYHMAFIGQYYTEGLSWTGFNKYTIPRITILNSTTMDDYRNLFK